MLENIQLLLLVVTANGAPILLQDLLGQRWQWPLDRGRSFVDGRPLLGRSVTVRGLVGAILVTTVAAIVLGFQAHTGMLIGLFAMIGDALSSFVKRRLGIAPGSRAIGLDQVPESLLPLLAVRQEIELGWWTIGVLVVAFTLFSLTVSRMLFHLNLRQRPY